MSKHLSGGRGLVGSRGRGPAGSGRLNNHRYGNASVNNHRYGNASVEANLFNRAINNGAGIIQNATSALSFFRSFIDEKDPLAFMFNLDDRKKYGYDCLRKAFSLGFADDDTLNDGIVAFLGYLGNEQFNQGTVSSCTSQCYMAAYETPGFLDALSDALVARRIKDVAAIAWFLVSIARHSHQVREDSRVLEIVKVLLIHNDSSVVQQLITVIYPAVLSSRALASKILGEDHVIDPESVASLEQLRAMEPQHDNDYPFDYRKVAIVPTADEINFQGSSVGSMVSWTEESVDRALVQASILDRQFRLLREDMIAPLKQELEMELSGKAPGQHKIFRNPAILNLVVDDKQNATLLIRVDTPPAILGRLRKLKSAERISLLSDAGRRVLSRDALVVFVVEERVRFVGVISNRDERQMCSEDARHLVVGISFLDNTENFAQLLCLKHTAWFRKEIIPVAFATFMFQASTSLFAYQPVLERLQDMVAIPFAKQLAHREPPSELSPGASMTFPESVIKNLQSDNAQLLAVKRALEFNLTLVQGPPGTGKTYVGVQMAKAILDLDQGVSMEEEKILCLCYTNHALDSFLESLMDAGVPAEQIVRLGKSPKISDRLKSRCMEMLPDSRFDRSQNKRFAILKSEAKDLAEKIDVRKRELLDPRQISAGSWRHFELFAETNAHEIVDENQTSYSLEQYRKAFTVPSIIIHQDGFKIVGARGEAIKDDYLWRTWCEGKTFPRVFHSRLSPDLRIWGIGREQRKLLLERFTKMRHEFILRSLAKDMQKLDELNTRRLRCLRNETKLSILRQARIIGCTTTSAAKNSDTLMSARPTCVIVEEASEILEAHVLTTTFSSVRRLIMIGDHFQLRPKLEHYPLRKDSGQYVDFDVSLFERLVTQPEGFPYLTLNIQHRMRPEISKLVRNITYPQLEDHPTVMKRDHIRGVASDVIFVNHGNAESSDEDLQTLGTNSKVNLYEVDMVVLSVQHLLRQFYDPSEIVVLTPYLGQLRAIQKALSKRNLAARIGDLDRRDLAKAQVEVESDRNGEKKDSVRVATIDNFQGEEARIIIGSLVRSNGERDIGFMSGAERVNVFCSRARDGFVVFGDAETYRNARSARGRNLWSKLLDNFVADGQMFTGLPVVCQRHNIRVPQLTSREDFEKHSPQGGCAEPCNQPLKSCPHLCHMMCHPLVNPANGEDVHAKIACTYVFQESCSQGHPVSRVCSENREKCQRQVKDICGKGHASTRSCWKQPSKICSTCEDIEKHRIEMERRALRESEKATIELQKAQEKLQEVEDALFVEISKRDQELHLRRIKREEELARAQIESVKAERSQFLNNLIDSEKTDLIADSAEKSAGSTNVSISLVASARNMLQSTEESPPACVELTEPIDQIVPARAALSSTTSLELAQPQNSPTTKVPVEIAAEKCSPGPYIPNIAGILQCFNSDTFTKAFKLVSAQLKRCNLTNFDKLVLSTLLCISKLFLGENVNDNLVALEEIKAASLGEGAYPVAKHDSMKLLCALLHFAAAVAEDKLGEFPLSVAEHAKAFLSLSSAGEIGLTLPTAWTKKAEEISKTVVANKPSKTRIVSASLERWKNAQKNGSIKSHSLDTLVEMIGLESVKSMFIDQYHKIGLSIEQGVPLGQSSYNARYDGNPGTGKTTVARLYATFLRELGVLPKTSIVVETSGSTLISGNGVEAVKKHLEDIKKAKGGAIFIDEAYQLSPKEDQQGRKVLDFILTHSEKLEGSYGPVVWIFAGYADKMEKLFEHNPGLPSRFPCHFIFDDYSDEELLMIFKSLLVNRGSAVSVATPPKQPKATSIQMPSLFGYGVVSQKADQIDAWDNVWRWNASQSTWEDDYNNISGYGTRNLGDASNPLVSRDDKSMWMYSPYNKLWTNKTKPELPGQPDYPGRPKTTVGTKKLDPFFVSDDKWMRIAISRLGKQRGRVGFGNARAVRILFDKTMQRQAARISDLRQMGLRPNIMEFTRDDLLGPRGDRAAIDASQAYKQLMAMEGLSMVKQEINKMLEMVMLNAAREEDEKKLIQVPLNRVFLGNPGTGKTTVSKLYGRILADLGLLSKGDVIGKNPSDFIGSVIGSSEQQTRSILQSAEGSVLVIDEAYLLNPSASSKGGSDPYKASVIDTIVEQVQGTPGDDRAVILLGYRNEMEKLFADSNPGLARRFQIENAFQFEDYDDDALLRILLNRCSSDQIKISVETASLAIKKLAKARALPNFGNAGSVNNLLASAKINMQARQSKLRPSERKDVLLPEDFGVEETQRRIDPEELFAGLVCCDALVKKLEEYQNLIKACAAKGQDPKKYVEFNFVFAGSPGTGKTTAARRMGRMFHLLGLLPCDDVIEVSASDLITGYVGQAGKKSLEVLNKSRGKVLFIDEAYRLNPTKGGQFMQEVVDELVQQLTSTEFKNRLVVILAGYKNDMSDLMNVNEGLKSRFSETILFEDFSLESVVTLLTLNIRKEGLAELSDNAIAAIPHLSQELMAAPGFGNGRDVETLTKRIIRAFASRSAAVNDETGGGNLMIDTCDLDNAFRQFIKEKWQSSSANATRSSISQQPLQQPALMEDARPISTSLAPGAQRTLQRQAVSSKDIKTDDSERMEISGAEVASFMSDVSPDPFLVEMQKSIDDMGLNSELGVEKLASLELDSEDFQRLVDELVRRTGLAPDEARDKLISWRAAQADVRAKMKEQEKETNLAKMEKRRALLPIWRCGVCGRANKPYIACYVQPYIVEYRECDV